MENIAQVNVGIVAVSRDCFPIGLSKRRREAVVEAYGQGLYACPVTVESESDVAMALSDLQVHGVNALVVFLGNFGPETPETLLGKYFPGPVMYVAAAEGDGDLYDGRGDAFCGMLNCSYNLRLRSVKAYISDYPIGTAGEVASQIRSFLPVARAYLSLRELKIISFGPRPSDFLACNAPIQGLFDLGVEIEENSELDLLSSFNAHAGDARIDAVVADMANEIGSSPYEGILPRLAQYEVTLLDWAESHRGGRKYVAFANKCWPAFEKEFKFVPCYVNSRLTARGIPVSCEVDIYGALSEYIGLCISEKPVTLLDINNTVPRSMFEKHVQDKTDYLLSDTFMGFHCGNTACSLLSNPHMGYQLIMKRGLEPDLPEPDITRGTMEGDIKAGAVTVYRLQSTAKGKLVAYIAQGEVLDVPTESFGSIGVFAITEMGRFYRHVLIEKQYPHHAAIAFCHCGKDLFSFFRYLGIEDISYNQGKNLPYVGENPFQD
ncbi:L-fucose isomerase family protein [Sphaerochaeta pleomorpha str. Grapes]|uniref:L-fucose isomerase family protein n=1 Tax=Sphaerochaeta pleomorpha (strain ATCC BAA-1885 / DSM 22778 / Grapes) TaxID=158190 RepID=G8QXG0_SPHPG|nr:fucose isomerase [Sphaerochaeta pleomorpha]AEV28461.1 L-fucose isomerase family protein [Sphaerochaeta pleomorpha str. Grapes]